MGSFREQVRGYYPCTGGERKDHRGEIRGGNGNGPPRRFQMADCLFRAGGARYGLSGRTPRALRRSLHCFTERGQRIIRMLSIFIEASGPISPTAEPG